jgi:hypothetical protein
MDSTRRLSASSSRRPPLTTHSCFARSSPFARNSGRSRCTSSHINLLPPTGARLRTMLSLPCLNGSLTKSWCQRSMQLRTISAAIRMMMIHSSLLLFW